MDSLAHLALMTKAQLVFAAPDTFLSFPALSPLSYPPDQLSFASGNALSAQQLRSFSEFSRVTNSLPLGTIFQPRQQQPGRLDSGEAVRARLTAQLPVTRRTSRPENDAAAFQHPGVPPPQRLGLAPGSIQQNDSFDLA